MRKLSFIIFIIFGIVNIYSQSPHGINFNLECSSCHSAESWNIDYEKFTFDHSTTGFELLGVHSQTDCKSCHATLEFSNVKKDCFQCHTDVHENTLGNDCNSCHDFKSWIVTNVLQIHQFGRFPLIGAHQTADCNQCHTSSSNLRYEPIGVECIDCHRLEFNFAQNPNHITSGFSTDCTECHSMNQSVWNFSNFAHDFFPLTGGHSIGNCFDCHSNGTFEGLNKDCYSCHKNDYETTQSPNHIEINLPTDCSECHTINPGWSPAEFTRHNEIYPLLGAHELIKNDCQNCHTSGYQNTPDQCIGCHQENYNSTTNPSHTQLNFSTDCETCHNFSAWKPAEFDHDNEYFPIYSGKHSNEWVACSDCHTDQNNYAKFECINCHEHNQNSMDDKHRGVDGYIYSSEACFSCHPNGDGEGAFNHNQSNFPLTGAHGGEDCSSCHLNGYTNTSTECFSCHENNFNGTTNPNHTQLSFSNNCSDCHNTETGWQLTAFPIHNNFYELLGAHLEVQSDCFDCHKDDYNIQKDICLDCHISDFNNSSNPNHSQLNFSNNCEDCHNTNRGWELTSFTIHSDYYVLTGAHVGIANNCSNCHNNDYNNTTNICYDCHTTDYQTATNPSHSGSSFPTDCETCHTTSVWNPSTFEHDGQYFPIYSGEHRGEWNLCSDCHTNQSDYGIFSCIDCHEHNKSEMDSEHNGVNDYVYSSIACYDCHPNGKADKFMKKFRILK